MNWLGEDWWLRCLAYMVTSSMAAPLLSCFKSPHIFCPGPIAYYLGAQQLLLHITTVRPAQLSALVSMTDRIGKAIINTTGLASDLVDMLLLRASPIFYIDLEGVDLCRDGTISILTVIFHVNTTTCICLVDVHTLDVRAFNTHGTAGEETNKTLKDILQDRSIPKAFFNVRNDSDALFAHYGIALQGIEDVQLMEGARRKTTASRRFVNGLHRGVEDYVVGGSESATWRKNKQVFRTKYGGSYRAFNTRPMPEVILAYCVGDVQYLPELRNKFWEPQGKRWRDLVIEESRKRVAGSQRSDYQPHGRDRALAPWSEE
jgi:exonuclease 3'-5' domain-containing protein 1